MENQDQHRIQNIILELEKGYPFFKKMDIYSSVNNAYKKVHAFSINNRDKEPEEIKKIAESDLLS